MIIVITTLEQDQDTKMESLVASHGVSADTGRTVILSNEHPSRLGAVFNSRIGEYVIYELDTEKENHHG